MEDAPETTPSGHKRRRACTSDEENEEDDAGSFDDDPSEDMVTEAGKSAPQSPLPAAPAPPS
eukprot:1293222-Prymnesium_polylepis.1